MSDKPYGKSDSFRDNEADSFTESGKGFVARRVTVDNSEKIPVLNDVEWDKIVTTKPDNVTEVYTYEYNSVVVQITTITYETSCKRDILSVVKNVI